MIFSLDLSPTLQILFAQAPQFRLTEALTIKSHPLGASSPVDVSDGALSS